MAAEEGELAADEGELVDALVRSSFAVMAVLSRIGAEHDLSLTQLRMLGILRDRRVTMSELADHLGLDKSTISGLVSRAEKRRLIERTRPTGVPSTCSSPRKAPSWPGAAPLRSRGPCPP
jgi:DNA-binding CsgD family transcriptional regulator